MSHFPRLDGPPTEPPRPGASKALIVTLILSVAGVLVFFGLIAVGMMNLIEKTSGRLSGAHTVQVPFDGPDPWLRTKGPKAKENKYRLAKAGLALDLPAAPVARHERYSPSEARRIPGYFNYDFDREETYGLLYGLKSAAGERTTVEAAVDSFEWMYEADSSYSNIAFEKSTVQVKGEEVVRLSGTMHFHGDKWYVEGACFTAGDYLLGIAVTSREHQGPAHELERVLKTLEWFPPEVRRGR